VSTPDHEALLDQVDRRLSVVEDQQFTLSSRVARAEATAERAANGLDDLEAMFDDLASGASALQVAGGPIVFNDALLASEGELGDPFSPPPAPARQAAQPAGPAQPAAEPSLAAVYAWVATHVAPMQRKLTTTGEGGGIRWCGRWWLHFDARTRFTALYQQYVALADEDQPGWQSVFLRDHFDPHFSVLTSPYGPFAACNRGHHSDTVDELGQDALAQPASAPAATGSWGTS
jgi:hypothetical protein